MTDLPHGRNGHARIGTDPRHGNRHGMIGALGNQVTCAIRSQSVRQTLPDGPDGNFAGKR